MRCSVFDPCSHNNFLYQSSVNDWDKWLLSKAKRWERTILSSIFSHEKEEGKFFNGQKVYNKSRGVNIFFFQIRGCLHVGRKNAIWKDFPNSDCLFRHLLPLPISKFYARLRVWIHEEFSDFQSRRLKTTLNCHTIGRKSEAWKSVKKKRLEGKITTLLQSINFLNKHSPFPYPGIYCINFFLLLFISWSFLTLTVACLLSQKLGSLDWMSK